MSSNTFPNTTRSPGAAKSDRARSPLDAGAYGRLLRALAEETSPAGMRRFLDELLTEAERRDFSLRWRLMELLVDGTSHRRIAAALRISPCKITRGSKMLKEPGSVVLAKIRSEKREEERP